MKTRRLATVLNAYGMLLVLVGLCVFFSLATWRPQEPTSEAAAGQLARRCALVGSVVVVAGESDEDAAFAERVRRALPRPPLAVLKGTPPEVRAGLEALAGKAPAVIAASPSCAGWPLFDDLRASVPAYARVPLLRPVAQRQSDFLSVGNLRNVADQIAVIAIMAVGMTAVILTGGIDLSVGSLVALAAVVTASLIHRGGGEQATTGVMVGASLAAVLLCGLVGLFSGAMITGFAIPPFIATLAMMQVGSGLAYMLSKGQSIYDLPVSFTRLGRGAEVPGLPNGVVLMVAIYVLAHIALTQTAAGRAIYAVGGNPEAARLSGLRTQRTLLGVYLASGLMAGLGGVMTASQLKAGAPMYGTMYELYVIAAVVVGGTSLAGGQGRVMGTLVGAFIIAVIRNGMNLMGIEPYSQKVVLGLVILGAVLIDRLKRKG